MLYSSGDLLQKHFCIKGLAEVSHASLSYGRLACLRVVVRSDDQDRQVIPQFPKPRKQFQPAHSAQMDVEDQTLWGARKPGVEKLGRRSIREDSQISGLQEARQRSPDRCIVVNDGHEGWGHESPPQKDKQ
jgi:hypothetical protein